MKRTIVTTLAAALLITPAANAQARGFGGLVGGIIAGAIIAHSYRHAYRPRYYAPRPRQRTVRAYPTKPRGDLAQKCRNLGGTFGCSTPHTQPGYTE
jgi:hypothetical protein